MADNTQPRTLGEAKLDARYGICFHALNERLLRRIHGGILFAKFIAGATAFSLLFQNVDKFWGLVGAAFLTAMVGVELVWRPIEASLDHRDWGARYNALLRRADLDSLEAFDRAMADIHDDGFGLNSLEQIAYNRNVVSHGYESYVRPLNFWQRQLARLV